MNIFVNAKPNSKKPGIFQLDPTHFAVAVQEVPEDGKANEAIRVVLAKHLKVKRSDVILVTGEKTRKKIFSVPLSPEELKGMFELTKI